MDKTAEVLINRLPLEVRQEVNAHSLNAAKPWERVHHTRSLPNLSACLGSGFGGLGSGGHNLSRDGSGEFGSDYVHRLPRGPDLEGGSRAAEVAALLGGFGTSSSLHGGASCGGEGTSASCGPTSAVLAAAG